MQVLPEIIAERYRVISEIGRGGMGRVLHVVHENTGEHLALKLMLSFGSGGAAAVERFKREARAFALIKSEHVVRVIDAGVAAELDGAPYLAMELLEGLDLETLAVRRGSLQGHEVTELLSQAARALDRAHALGIVHRDLKPANLFVHDDQGRTVLKVLDFGISSFATGGRLTSNGALLGTPYYMAPEQVDSNEGPIGPAADVWAIGMVAFRLLAGRVYWAVDGMRVLTAILSGDLPRPSERAWQLDKGFDSWFARSCARLPGDRFATVGEQIVELGRALAVDARNRQNVTLATLRSEGEPRPTPPRDDSATATSAPDTAHLAALAIAKGAAIAKTALAPRVPPPSPKADTTPGRERRQVTGLFAKLSVTALPGAELDPEDRADALARATEAVKASLKRAGSTLFADRGDGVLASFGFPIAYGDDALRAVMAGLELSQIASRIAPTGVRISVRVGIDTGTVIANATAIAGDVRGLVGEVMERAPSIAQAATAGDVWVSAPTFRLLRGAMEGDPLPKRELDGGETVELVHVIGEAPPTSLPSTASASQSALVGRDAELALLEARWEAAESGTELVLVTGEPGVGKTRLLSSLSARVAATGGRWFVCRCSQLLAGTPLHPFIDGLERLAGIRREDDEATRKARIEEALSDVALSADAKQAISALVGGSTASSLNLSPLLLRQRTLEAIVALVTTLAEDRRTCLAVEDAQWADPTSLELLGTLVSHADGPGLLLIVSARPELVTPWAPSAVTQIGLGRLPRARVEALIHEVAKGRELPPELVAEIIDRSDGVPLYVEELTLSVLESLAATDGDEPPPSMRRVIPTTLRESLTARFDRAGESKATAQLAAVLGRTFPLPLLWAVSTLEEATLARHVETLISLGLLRRSGSGPNATLSFKHALLQEAAYESLLKPARREAHLRAAHALEAKGTGRDDGRAAELAHHYENAGDAAAAVKALSRAGREAMARSAVVEASQYFDRALARVGEMSEGPDRVRAELGVRTAMGTPLMILRGYGAPEVETNYAQALDLAERVAGGPELVPLLWGLWIFHQVRGRYARARALADRLLALAEGGDGAARVTSNLAAGTTATNDGRVAEARRHLEIVLAECEGGAHRDLAAVLGHDPGSQAGGLLSWSLWLLGDDQKATESAAASVARARQLLHPNSLGFALYTSASLHQFQGHAAEAERESRELLTLASEQRLVHWLGLAGVIHGWAVAMAGDATAGLDEMLAGRARWHATGARASTAYWDSALARLLISLGRGDEAEPYVRSARAVVADAGERSFDPEVTLAEAELALGRGGADAEALFRAAVDRARALGMPGKARACADRLVRFLVEAGRGDEATAVIR
jgi:serine/threonine protein kinase/tetratricopeptide (TPR) repeat protein